MPTRHVSIHVGPRGGDRSTIEVFGEAASEDVLRLMLQMAGEVDVDVVGGFVESAAPDLLPLIQRVEVLPLAPTDVIVLACDGEIPTEWLDRVGKEWRARSGLPNRVVVTAGLTVSVVRPEEAP